MEKKSCNIIEKVYSLRSSPTHCSDEIVTVCRGRGWSNWSYTKEREGGPNKPYREKVRYSQGSFLSIISAIARRAFFKGNNSSSDEKINARAVQCTTNMYCKLVENVGCTNIYTKKGRSQILKK